MPSIAKAAAAVKAVRILEGPVVRHLTGSGASTSTGGSQERPFASKSDIEYCREMVRQRDHDNYLCSLFSPPHVREMVWATRALNVELAHIGDIVSQEAAGRLRFEFWKNAVSNVFAGQPPQMPVARALTDTVHRFKLSRMWFRRLLKTREQNLFSSEFATVEELQEYGENTIASLVHMHLEALGVRDMQADQAARAIGQSSAIVTALRSLPHFIT
ncbi:hypothetical protein EV182_001354, partial [Spiromyces aspiralis]